MYFRLNVAVQCKEDKLSHDIASHSQRFLGSPLSHLNYA